MRALIVTHGNLGQALIESAQQILGDLSRMDTLSNSRTGVSELTGEIQAWAGQDEEAIFVFVDVGGGSCGTAAQMALRSRARSWILGGVNLPMILTYMSGAERLGASDMASKLLDRALNSVRILGDESEH